MLIFFCFPTRPWAPRKLRYHPYNLCVASTGMAPATQYMLSTHLSNCQVVGRTELGHLNSITPYLVYMWIPSSRGLHTQSWAPSCSKPQRLGIPLYDFIRDNVNVFCHTGLNLGIQSDPQCAGKQYPFSWLGPSEPPPKFQSPAAVKIMHKNQTLVISPGCASEESPRELLKINRQKSPSPKSDSESLGKGSTYIFFL